MFLNCHSYHSLRYGTIPVEDLVTELKNARASAAVITDINATTGIYDFVISCQKQGIKPICGIEFRNDKLLYIGIAKNQQGFARLSHFLTDHNLAKKALPLRAPELRDVVFVYPLSDCPDDLRSDEFIGVRREQVNRLIRYRKLVPKMMIWQPVTIRSKKEFNLHKILRAIDNNVLLSKLTEADFCYESENAVLITEIQKDFSDYPQIIENTVALLDACNFEFNFDAPKNKKFYTNSRQSDRLLLERLAYEGMVRRYGTKNEPARKRVEREIKVIDELGFAGYFLFTWDIIRYSMSRGFYHVGRGSGANSIVAYCLGITDICPLELDLYFERFLNPSRSSPPDFDIDWSWKDRDEILDYIFKRFDTAHTAFVGTISEFKYRSIIREIGKVFGLPKEELDVLANNPQSEHDNNVVVRLIHEYGQMLDKYPNQRSVHSCGILISEEPLANFAALEMPPKGFPTMQLDMYLTDKIGFEKLDILSQRGIGHINDCVELIKKNRGIKVDIRDISLSKNEAQCNEFLRHGKTIGCFYIESPAMRGLLRRLKCDSYKVLVAASSVIRPGVAQSGMMAEYIYRHNNPGKFEYFHDVFKEQLGETYGIMVYQEDVIKIAHHFAGLDLADADILRRAMSGKTRSKEEFEGVRSRFFKKCKEKGYPDVLSQEVYRQIESFAGYSFCKAHSASYAVESYQSLYLKVYYPVEFMVAVINNFGGFYRTEIYVHEARMSGASILNPCVNHSDFHTSLFGTDVYLGFIHLQNLSESMGKLIPEERERNGDYSSLEDFILRTGIAVESLQILIFIGAFRFTGKTKSELILEGRMLLSHEVIDGSQKMLFHTPSKKFQLPPLERSVFEDAFDEIELLDFPVSCSPFDLLQTKHRGEVMVRDLLNYEGKRVRMIGYLISRKHVPTKRGLMNFGTWYDVEGAYFDTTHFPDCLQKFPFQGGGCYLIQGIVNVEQGFPSVTVEKSAKLPFIPDPRYAEDQDRKYRIYDNIREDVSVTHRAPYPSEQEIGLPRTRMIE